MVTMLALAHPAVAVGGGDDDVREGAGPEWATASELCGNDEEGLAALPAGRARLPEGVGWEESRPWL